MVAIKISALVLFVTMAAFSSATPIEAEPQTLEARARGNAVVYTSVGPSCDRVVERQAFQGDNVHICHEVTNIGSLRVEGRYENYQSLSFCVTLWLMHCLVAAWLSIGKTADARARASKFWTLTVNLFSFHPIALIALTGARTEASRLGLIPTRPTCYNGTGKVCGMKLRAMRLEFIFSGHSGFLSCI